MILILASVLLLCTCGLLLYIDSTRAPTLCFLRRNWGSIASVAGFFLSIYVLIVAKGAQTAARQAVSAERLRTALDDLADATDKCDQVGLFAQEEKWQLVSLRAAEVHATCHSTVARWKKNDTLRDLRNKLLQVATLMRSIIEEIDNQTPDKKSILQAQRDSGEKLAVVVGTMKQESGSI